MIYLVALLAAAGGAFIGALLGLGQFALVFELLRALDRDAPLDSKFALAAFSFSFAAIGFAAGLALAWRWRPAADTAPAWWQTVTVAVLASAGAAALVFLGDVTGLVGRMFQLIEFGEILVLFVSMAVLALIAGATLAVLTFAGAASWKAKAVAIPIAFLGGFAVIMGGIVADKQFSGGYRNLGSGERTALVEIRMPTAMDAQADGLRVTLRSGTTTIPARGYYLERHAGHVVVRTAVNVSNRTRERLLVVSMAGRPELTVPLNAASNPRIMHEFGPWQPLGPDGMAIRFLTR
jgi:hypothetical protein